MNEFILLAHINNEPARTRWLLCAENFHFEIYCMEHETKYTFLCILYINVRSTFHKKRHITFNLQRQ